MVFGFNEAWPIASWGVFTFWQISSYTSTSGRRWYDKNKPDWAPPGSFFPWIWFLLYAACTTAIYFFTKNTTPDSWNIILGVTMYIIHMVANKYWSVLFFDMNDPEAAINILVFVMLPTGIALLVAFIVDQGGIFWVPVMLLSIYIAWLLYAATLNVYWVQNRLGTSDDDRDSYKRRRVTIESDKYE